MASTRAHAHRVLDSRALPPDLVDGIRAILNTNVTRPVAPLRPVLSQDITALPDRELRTEAGIKEQLEAKDALHKRLLPIPGEDNDVEAAADRPDPWGEGPDEHLWGKGTKLKVIQALGSWCAAISAYDRLVRPRPESHTERAVAAESEWHKLQGGIVRGQLDVRLEEFRQVQHLLALEAVNEQDVASSPRSVF